ncbi:hypothetical protein HD600_002251 [Microbacterium ginsengiterrae]|uniref:Zinicin-like metallopeptidase n=1 Tax=Microbacterium ginsengiterrae TaxID=546115 RepID=A0A7W9CDR8_9MICO|nr:hypothetical protein [Microbacterium ginsengiterrae]MBB5743754.1 hypothetical protein [Microbacterium ginsengiterrae]
MPRRRTSAAPRRGARHGRHGRLGRSEVVRPPLPPLDGRIDRFDATIGSAVEFLRSTWPELQEVRFEIGGLPATPDEEGIPRWRIDRDQRRIVLFRIPIERLLPPGHDDGVHRRIAIESAVFRAAAEYVGRDPWEFGPGQG